MEKVNLGNTGLEVTRLGLGLAEISRQERSGVVVSAEQVLDAALDGGINFLDTAACYSSTEELIGRTVARRRDEYILASKCGHAVGEATGDSWTSEVVAESIDRSLVRMDTDHLDLIQLHSCSLDILKRGEVIEPLLAAKQAGKTRFVGYSGDNEAAEWAVASGIFDTLQTSFNLVDQSARKGLLAQAKEKGMGIIIKRPVANGVWRKDGSPHSYADEYAKRAEAMGRLRPVPGAPEDPVLLAVGFVYAHPEVETAIVGTHNPAHLVSNIEMVEKHLPIDDEAVKELYRRFDELGDQWPQLL